MGGAASTSSGENGAQVDHALVSQQAQKIAQLSSQLEAANAEILEMKSKLGGALRPSIVKEEAAKTSAVAAGKTNRREEVSAEAWNKRRVSQTEIEAYERIVVPKSDDVKVLIKTAVDANMLFKGLRAEEKDECVDAFYMVKLTAGECAITQGDVGDKFFVVESGELEVLVAVEGAQPAHYGQVAGGDSFGELALMYSKPRAATIKATSDCVLWAINRQDFRNIHLHQKMLRKEVFESYLRKVPDLQHLNPQEISRLADAVDEEEFEEGSVIIREGEIGDIFYIIEWGDVEYSKKKEGVVGKGGSGDYFGHKALLTEEKRAATVTALTKVACLTMGRNDFVTLLGSLQEIEHRKDDQEEDNIHPEVDGPNGTHKYHIAIKFEDLERKFMRKNKPGSEREIILGQGAFGKVQIVKHRNTGETFALKCLNKSQIVENGLEAHVVDERKVMTMIDHPFLLKMHNSYWDEKYVYLLLELCLGGELFTALRKAGRFSEKATKFYSSIVLQAFGHLHSKDIVYRDLKPENLMLDDKGYIKVVDFGLAKVVKDRTWTLCGTPDYLAPEIILTKGHDKAVDYWALGVLTYECTAGYVPFYADDPMDVYQLILDGELKFPTHFSRSCCDLIRKLLNPFQSKRLGNTKEGIQAIIKHRWFAGYDWEGLYARTLVPPIRPKVSSPEDTSNFDEYPVEGGNVADCSWVPPFPHQVKDGVTIDI